MTFEQLLVNRFTLAYIDAALWSSTDDDGEPLDANYSVRDIDAATRKRMADDCAAFLDANWEALATADLEQGGHDFWLTRNGHGCGYWDGDWAEPHATELTDAAHRCGEFNLYIGDDGRIDGM